MAFVALLYKAMIVSLILRFILAISVKPLDPIANDFPWS